MEDIEDNDFVASEHDHLISAISKLDKTQHITEPTRSEPTNVNSEFNLIKRSNKLNLDNVAKVLGKTAHHVEIGKKLKKSGELSKVLPKPLEKPQAQRIKRSTGYDEVKKKVARWDPVVARNRTVDFVSFPLKLTTVRPKNVEPTKEFLSKLSLKSDLEMELDAVDPKPVVEEPEEEAPLYPMSYEEMLEHRQQSAKLRAQESYKAAKAKRQSKIKSKKYHRILKKERLKQQLKEFEELQKKDPEEALKKLASLENARALERHTLRHKSTGKWAKNKLIRAKYDKEVRQQLAEQLAISRGLTEKIQDNDSTDDEPDDSETIPNIAVEKDPFNPWMTKQGDKSNVNTEFDFGYKKYILGRMYKKNDSDESSDDDEEFQGGDELDVIKCGVKNVVDVDGNVKYDEENNVIEYKIDTSKFKAKDVATKSDIVNDDKDKVKYNKRDDMKNNKLKRNTKSKDNKPEKKSKAATATSNWIVESIDNTNIDESKEKLTEAFDTFENKIEKQVEAKLMKLRKNIERLEKKNKKEQPGKKREEFDSLDYLKMRTKNTKAIIDEELNETGNKTEKEPENSLKDLLNQIKDTKKPETNKTKMNIDPSRFIEVKPKYLNSVVPDMNDELDQLDDEQVVPKVNIEEVFEEDDVVASFRQEKEDEANKDNPQDIDLSLPGWGSWGGIGVKPQKRRRNRFILKAPPKMPRRDENKGDVIIKEYNDPKLAVHKVSQLPFPFTSVKDYEASIRTPLGNTFIPEKAHKKLIKPSVITKSGAVIQPMDEDELLVKKNRTFKNESVIKLLGQK